MIVALDGPNTGINVEHLYHETCVDNVWVTREKQGYWGHPLRNMILDQTPDGEYVWTIDDDDVAAPGALTELHKFLTVSDMLTWGIFKMEFGPGSHAHGITCWREPLLRRGDIGTPMIFAPKGAARFGHVYDGDWNYAEQLQAELGEPEWAKTVIAHIRPDINDAEF